MFGGMFLQCSSLAMPSTQCTSPASKHSWFWSWLAYIPIIATTTFFEWSRTHYSDIVSAIPSGSIYGRKKHVIWHSFWHIRWHSIWHSFWYSFWHLFWQLFRSPLWHSIWHLSWHIQHPMRSGTRNWNPAAHWALELAGKEKATLIRSRDRYLAGGKKWNISLALHPNESLGIGSAHFGVPVMVWVVKDCSGMYGSYICISGCSKRFKKVN